jgi:glutamate synthase (NADPH/NADH)
MGLTEDFDDRQTQIDAENDEYHPYVYQTENNSSWASALPVKQYVAFKSSPLSCCSVTNKLYL